MRVCVSDHHMYLLIKLIIYCLNIFHASCGTKQICYSHKIQLDMMSHLSTLESEPPLAVQHTVISQRNWTVRVNLQPRPLENKQEQDFMSGGERHYNMQCPVYGEWLSSLSLSVVKMTILVAWAAPTAGWRENDTFPYFSSCNTFRTRLSQVQQLHLIVRAIWWEILKTKS